MSNKTKQFTSLFFGLLLNIIYFSTAQADDHLWQEINSQARSTRASFSHTNSRRFLLDETKMQQLLKQTTYAHKGTAITPIALPLPDGETVYVSPVDSDVLPAMLANKYPQIKTYKIVDTNNEIIDGRLDFTPSGFHAMLQTDTGDIVYIDPIQTEGQRYYQSYKQKDQHPNSPHQCSLKNDTPQASSINTFNQQNYRLQKSSLSTLYRYTIAIAATGEYTQKQGGTVVSALSAIATTINRINQIYERDLGIHLTLANNNDAIIYTDALSDPYSNGKTYSLMTENQRNLDQVIGKNNYDIGHVFGTAGGGVAIIESLCSSSSKAKGTSGISDLNSESFYIDFVAHEIGHQLGATHTFNSNQGLCAGNTRTSRTAFEPGSGSTIMAYTGICGSDNLQNNADAMFHIGSIEQIKKNITQGTGSRCGTRSTNNNHTPIAHAGRDYTIPAGTPFTLDGSADDADNDQLIYSWQQIDAGTQSSVNKDLGNNALFRARLANTSPSRTFPILNDILTHRHSKGETLPSTQRRLTFKFIAQDGNNNTSSDTVRLQVENTGSRFALDMPYSHYTIGENNNVTWNVAKTNQAPIHCTSVDIDLSTDGGQNFTTRLASNIPNNGKASIYIPNTIQESSRARFKISCSDNIFFAISYNNFNLNHTSPSEDTQPVHEPNLAINKLNNTLTQENNNNVASRKGAGSFGFSLVFLFMLLAYKLSARRANRSTQ